MVMFLTPRQAVDLIQDGDTMTTLGATATCHAEELSIAMEQRFLETGKPVNLTLVYTSGQGDGKDYGLNHFAHEGLLRRIIGGHWNMAPKLGKLAAENKVEAYNLPQGVLAQLFRETAAHRVGVLTHVGLQTFVDPRLGGGKINDVTTEDLVEVVNVAGRELLLYKSFPINACFLRATSADEKGNITMEKECATLDATAMAMAVKNSGGKVIVQVERVVKAGSLDPKLVKIPHIYVDAVVVVSPAKNMPEMDPTMGHAYCGETRIPTSSLPCVALDERKIIARRAVMELQCGSVVNLGIGMPEVVAMVANEEGMGDFMTLTLEAGPVGGIPAGGLLFGASTNPDAILDMPYQFDFYDGGGLDQAFLGLAEADEQGNINVSKMGARVTGCGGFINITQNAKQVFFCGTFTGKGLKIAVRDGAVVIEQEGSLKKFVQQVGQITFSGKYAQSINQPVLYITERAVFGLRPDGLHLLEVAPGIDIDRDILAHMDFMPKMDTPPRLMDARLFAEAPMRLLEDATR